MASLPLKALMLALEKQSKLLAHIPYIFIGFFLGPFI